MSFLLTKNRRQRGIALTVALFLLAPLVILAVAPLPAVAQGNILNRAADAWKNSSKGKKVVIVLAGAALLYYLYKKHQASQKAQSGQNASTPAQQLYRSKNGGVYYRDANHKPVWLTVPQQGVAVPAADVQQYAPNYARYNGPAPAVPRGYQTQSVSQFDPSLAPAAAPGGPPGPGR